MTKRTDFCEPECGCAIRGEVLCCKLLPAVVEWAATIPGISDPLLICDGNAIELINALWVLVEANGVAPGSARGTMGITAP